MNSVTKTYSFSCKHKLSLYSSGAILFGVISLLILAACLNQSSGKSLEAGIGLHEYRLSSGPITISEVKVNASDLTFSSSTGTLFLIINAPTEIHELSLTGEHLRRIALQGFHDTEGIVHLEADRFAIIEERRQNVATITITPETKKIKRVKAHILSVGEEDYDNNKGLEGITYNSKNDQLIMVKEKYPRTVLRMQAGRPSEKITRKKLWPWEWASMDDLSALQYLEAKNHLLLLSDESRRIEERSNDGQLIASLNLKSGKAGLTQDVPQAEGLVLVPDGTLFVCSEPNLLYIFNKAP